MTRAERKLPAEQSPDPHHRRIYACICALGASGRDDWRACIDRYIDRVKTPQDRNLYRKLRAEYLSHYREPLNGTS